MVRRLDHSKGGFYTRDPAREQRRDDFVKPDETNVKKRNKNRKRQDPVSKGTPKTKFPKTSENETPISQRDLLTSLRISRRDRLPKKLGPILKQLVQKKILLENGKPNADHPIVKKLLRTQGLSRSPKER